jgi:hypothetical protein
MRPGLITRSTSYRLISLMLASSLAIACAPAVQGGGKIPPAPVLTLWPDPTYTSERQCHGGYKVEELSGYLHRAQVALWLPSTRGVVLDQQRRCLVITVDGYGAGRLVELVMRGMAVPRGAVLLLVG